MVGGPQVREGLQIGPPPDEHIILYDICCIVRPSTPDQNLQVSESLFFTIPKENQKAECELTVPRAWTTRLNTISGRDISGSRYQIIPPALKSPNFRHFHSPIN